MELVKKGFIYDMRNGIKALEVPKLQVLGKIEDILAMDSKGLVKNIVDRSGKSQYLYDVLEGAMKDPKGYKFLTKEAKTYVDELGKILDKSISASSVILGFFNAFHISFLATSPKEPKEASNLP